MKELRCREVGFDCDGVIHAPTEQEVLQRAAEHACTEHGLARLDDATTQHIRSKIRAA